MARATWFDEDVGVGVLDTQTEEKVVFAWEALRFSGFGLFLDFSVPLGD